MHTETTYRSTILTTSQKLSTGVNARNIRKIVLMRPVHSIVLDHYITQGVRGLDQEKLPDFLELKYHSVGDAVVKLGSVSEIRNVFIGFQEY